MKSNVSAGGIVVNAEGKVVVVCQCGESWSLPKGHVEENEAPIDAARREIFEETGIKQLNLIHAFRPYKRSTIVDRDTQDERQTEKTIHLFLFETNETSLQPSEDDISEAKWMDKQEVGNQLTHERDKIHYEEFIQVVL